jgi:hypothetical protein
LLINQLHHRWYLGISLLQGCHALLQGLQALISGAAGDGGCVGAVSAEEL